MNEGTQKIKIYINKENAMFQFIETAGGGISEKIENYSP